MPELEAMILLDSLDAFWRTLADVLETSWDDDIDEAFCASHCHLIAHTDLYKRLHDFTPKARAEFNGRVRVEADDEGGIFFRNWTTRPFSPEAELCRPN